jgi:hypothetical protein
MLLRMRRAPTFRVFSIASLLAGAAAWLVSACVGDEPLTFPNTDGGADSALPERDGSTADSGDPAPPDGGKDARPTRVDGPGEVGAECFFNRECKAALRCVCPNGVDCSCQPGTRGTGELGAPCDAGDQCSSSVCVEGPGVDYFCTDECAGNANCMDPLPKCIAFGGFGFCARDGG